MQDAVSDTPTKGPSTDGVPKAHTQRKATYLKNARVPHAVEVGARAVEAHREAVAARVTATDWKQRPDPTPTAAPTVDAVV